MKRYLHIIVMFCFCAIGIGQPIPMRDVQQLEVGLKETSGLKKIELLNTLAEIYLSQSNNYKAEIYAQTALDSIKKFGYKPDNLIMANLYSTLGSVNYNRGDYKTSAKYFEVEYTYLENSKQEEQVFYSLFNLGTIYKKLNSNKKSLQFYLKSLDLASKNMQEDILLQNYQALHETYIALNDAQNAMKYLRLYNNLRDSLLITEAKQEITILRTKYKTALQEKKKTEKELEVKKEKLEHTEKKLTVVVEQKAKLQEDSTIKEQHIEHLTETNIAKDISLQENQQIIRQQRTIIIQLIVIFIIILLFSFLLYYQYAQKRKAYEQIKIDKEIIERHVQEIEKKTQELIEVNGMKDKLFSIIGHDLRNAFNQILGFSELLQESIENVNKQHITLYAGEIHTSAKYAHKLLENLLEWSKSQSKKLIYNPEYVNCFALAEEMLTIHQPIAKQKNISFRIDIPKDVYVYADKNMLKTICRNLISNAIKFTSSDGHISIEIKKDKDNATEVRIKDTGVGIAKENIKKLFYINTHFSTRGTANEKGTGIGLLLCKEFMEKHNGSITIESEEGKGSCFILRFPDKTEKTTKNTEIA